MPTRSTRITFDGTSGFTANNQKISLLRLGGVIISATQAAVSSIKLIMKLAGLIISSATSIIGGLSVSATAKLLADFWQVTQSWTVGGVVVCSTAVVGGVTSVGAAVIQYLNGVIESATSLLGALGIGRFLGGAIACGTSVAGALNRAAQLLADFWQATSAWSLGGTIQTSTILTGNLAGIVQLLLGGIIACGTAVVNTGIAIRKLLGGIIICGTGGLYYVIAWLLGGVIQCSTAVAGGLTGIGTRFLNGAVLCSTLVVGGLSTIGSRLLGGVVLCSTLLVGGGIRLYLLLQGAVVCATSLASTNLKLGLRLAGAIVNNTVVSAALRLYMSLSGAIVSATVVLGNLFGLATWLFGGVVLCATPVVGALKLGRLLSGAVACVTVVSGTLKLGRLLNGVITSVTSIFGVPGGGVSYWGITGVTEPQHLWPFSITGDYSDQGSTGGLTLLVGQLGDPPSWDGSGYLILPENTYLYCANDADLGSLGSTFSIIWEWVGINDYHGLISCAEGAGAGDGWFTCPYQANSRVSTYNPHDTRNDNYATGNSLSTTGGINQAIWVQDGGNAVLYVNGEIAKTSTALTAPTNNTTNNFVINGVGGAWGSRTVHWIRVGVLKGTAWSSDDVAAIYAGPGPGTPLGVNITIRVLLSSLIACATSMAGALKLGRLLTGAIQCATSVMGNVFGFASWLLNGAIICATSVSGVLKLGRLLNGVIICATSMLGAINTISTLIIQYVGGLIISATSLLANVQRFATMILGGIIICATAVIGGLRLQKMLGGVVVCGTAILSGVLRLLNLAGSIVSTTSVLGGLRSLPPVLLGGVITCGTYVLGAFYLVGTRLLGGIIVCATYLYMGFLGPVVGGFGLGRHFIGGVHKWYIKAKERLKINW